MTLFPLTNILHLPSRVRLRIGAPSPAVDSYFVAERQLSGPWIDLVLEDKDIQKALKEEGKDNSCVSQNILWERMNITLLQFRDWQIKGNRMNEEMRLARAARRLPPRKRRMDQKSAQASPAP
jgi:hypothetical protein